MRTYVYIDGFNLYYGAVRGTPYKWLNLSELCQKLLPKNDIRQIRYFTALITPRPGDPDQITRQQTFLRALRTLPSVSIHYGQFLSHPARMRLVQPAGSQKFAEVWKTEEKGSDVNLATHLLCDAYESKFDVAVLVTNDSDLFTPADVVVNRLGRRVGIINPHQHQSVELRKVATFLKRIRTGALASSQFPPTLTDGQGTFHKPKTW